MTHSSSARTAGELPLDPVRSRVDDRRDAEVGKAVPLEAANYTFQAQAERIHNGFYEELVEHGYFDASPEQTRQRSKMLAWVGPILAAIVIFLVLNFAGAGSGWIVLPILAAVVLMIIGNKVATAMPVAVP